VDWSYDLLTPEEQRLFCQLAVFAAGCSLEAVEAVCDDGASGGAGLSRLRGLVEQSLVRALDHEGRSRYQLLETMRQYAAERLRETGEEPSLRTRHLAWFLELAGQSEEHLYGPDQQRWLGRLREERENFRAALAWSRSEPAHGGRACGSQPPWHASGCSPGI
jgi:predicted ATPase